MVPSFDFVCVWAGGGGLEGLVIVYKETSHCNECFLVAIADAAV